jgi:hypothetical protein
MYGKILVAIAGVTAAAEVTLLVLGRTGALGSGEATFIHFFGYGGSAAALAAVTALAVIVLAILRWSGLTATVLTLLLCALTIGVFMSVMILGPGV